MGTGMPWYRWYADRWLGDLNLRRCSLAARGLWKDMLDLMHSAEPRGHLLTDGKRLNDNDLCLELAEICRAPAHEIIALLAELEGRNIFSRDRLGTIYSRRMVEDTKLDKARSKGGKVGGAMRRKQWENGPQPTPHREEDHSLKKEEGRRKKEEGRLGVSESPSPTTNTEPTPRGRYFFEGRTIKLNRADFEQWEETFHAIPDLKAELLGLDGWLQAQPPAKRKNWFHSVPGMLSRKHQETLAKQQQDAAEEEETGPWSMHPNPGKPRMYLHHRDGGIQEIFSPEPAHSPWKIFRTDPDGTVHYHNPSDRPPINTPDDDGE